MSRPRSLNRRTKMVARGPGWRLTEGEGGNWVITLHRETDDAVQTWAHLLRTIREIADVQGLRALMIDLRGGERLGGTAAEAAALLFAEFEARGRRISVIVGADLIHAARVHRLMSFHAPECGGCFLTEGEGGRWLRGGPPPVAAPVRRGLGVAPRV